MTVLGPAVRLLHRRKDLLRLVAFVVSCALIGVFAEQVAGWLPHLSAPIVAILAGMLIINLVPGSTAFSPEAARTGRYALQLAIVCIGATLSLWNLLGAGTAAFAIMLCAIGAGLAFALSFGRVLNVPWRLRYLIGAGTSICGGSAIAATAPTIRATAPETAQAISVVFLFNILAIFIFPIVGNAFDFSNQQFGLWAGTSVNDTSAVAAVAYGYSPEAGDHAMIIKLARTIMIIPVTVLLGILAARQEGDSKYRTRPPAVPIFIVLFVAAVVLNSADLIPFSSIIGDVGGFVMLIALVAVGMQANFRVMIKGGLPQIALGFSTAVVISFVSLGLMWAFDIT